ncbi:MAG: CvpA family protein, partial [Clostridia bacterium]|nr:CvpA family protein [Clostridia bacterium]
MNIADYVVILIIAITLITGLFKGLLNTLYKLVSYVLSVYLAFKLAKPVSGWFHGT